MIRVFGKTDKYFETNGDIVLRPLKARVTKTDNGDYYLDLETGLEYAAYIVEGNIIVADTPQGAQAFRVNNARKTRTKVTAKCWHVFYDSKNYLIADSYVVDMDAAGALAHLNAATEPKSQYKTFSDVATVDSHRCVRKSLYEAVTTVIERWGGHLVRDNFTIGVVSDIGQDNGVVVRYRKNIKDISSEEDWSAVVTKLMPVGRDGLLLNALDASASPYITASTQYEIPYTKAISFNQDMNQEDFENETEYKKALVADLREQGNAYIKENCVPRVNYTLKANVDNISDVGDVIQVIDERIGVNMTTRLVKFVYDCVSKRYVELEFGNFQQTISGFAGSVASTIDRTVTQQVTAAKNAIMQDVKDITMQGVEYKAGDTIRLDGTRLCGASRDGSTVLAFSVPVAKSLAHIGGVTVMECAGGIATPADGMIGGDETDWRQTEGVTVLASVTSDSTVTVELRGDAPFPVVDNTTVTLTCAPLVLRVDE
jgi:phage minor structural protein